MTEYDAGYLSDFGGGNVDWWQDYVRAEIGRANEFCAVQYDTLAAENERLKEQLAAAKQARAVAEANLELRSMSNQGLRELIAEMVEGLEPFALISTEGVIVASTGHVYITTCAEYFHRAADLIARAKGAAAS